MRLAGKVDKIELFAMFAKYSCSLIGKMFKWCWQMLFNALVMKLCSAIIIFLAQQEVIDGVIFVLRINIIEM